MNQRTTPSYQGLRAASPAARRAARGSSKKAGTKSELILRRALCALGLRYRVNVPGMPGRPDIVLKQHRLVIFCDGDFWHGRSLKQRLAKLSRGHNAPYWVGKIRANVERDRKCTEQLEQEGWRVLRLWETDILRDPESAVAQVQSLIRAQSGHGNATDRQGRADPALSENDK